MAWNNDGSKLATGSWDKTVKIWAVGSAGTFKCESTLTGHSSSWDTGAVPVAWNYDGSKLATVSDKTVRIWAVGSAGIFECQSTLTVDTRGTVYGVSFSPNSNILAVCATVSTIRLYDPATGEVMATLSGHRYRQKL
jgi:WD40 repeat protein